jgi:hypothetical protein
MRNRREVAGLLLAAAVAGCRPDDSNIIRGHGLGVDSLVSVGDQASVYRASLAAAFHLDDPDLSLLLDPRLLPRVAGLGVGPPLSAALVTALRERNVVKGICQAPPEGTRKTLNCRADRPGYVVRFSDVFALARDSVQVYVSVQKYDTPQSGPTESLRFENVYQVVRHDGVWSAEREGRVRQKK